MSSSLDLDRAPTLDELLRGCVDAFGGGDPDFGGFWGVPGGLGGSRGFGDLDLGAPEFFWSSCVGDLGGLGGDGSDFWDVLKIWGGGWCCGGLGWGLGGVAAVLG
uniref:Uncharacterized protein n=1 Tax=Catharus ustulatus TaxID=91951 RepID=A0A8C3V0Q8_CATUS